MTTFLLALGFSIAIVAIWAWIGDWSGSRHRVEHRLASCRCPACGGAYGAEAAASSEELIVMDGANRRSITCPNCNVVREWQEDGSPAAPIAA